MLVGTAVHTTRAVGLPNELAAAVQTCSVLGVSIAQTQQREPFSSPTCCGRQSDADAPADLWSSCALPHDKRNATRPVESSQVSAVGHARQLIIHCAGGERRNRSVLHSWRAFSVLVTCSRSLVNLPLLSWAALSVQPLAGCLRLFEAPLATRPCEQTSMTWSRAAFARPRSQGIILPRMLCSVRTRVHHRQPQISDRKARHRVGLCHSVQATFGYGIWPFHDSSGTCVLPPCVSVAT